MRRVFLAVILLVSSACSGPESVLVDDPLSNVGLNQGVTGTVVWLGFEGGFWAIRTDDGRTLDPHASLPADFRVNNLRVRVVARALTEVACFHMAGIIVSVTSIERR